MLSSVQVKPCAAAFAMKIACIQAGADRDMFHKLKLIRPAGENSFAQMAE